MVLVRAGDDQGAEQRESGICQSRAADGEDLPAESPAAIEEQAEGPVAQKVARFTQDMVVGAEVRVSGPPGPCPEMLKKVTRVGGRQVVAGLKADYEDADGCGQPGEEERSRLSSGETHAYFACLFDMVVRGLSGDDHVVDV